MNVSSQPVFAHALLDPASETANGLRSRAGADLQRRFAVHRNSFVITLIDALADAFPVTRALVGEDFFRSMARERVRMDPPKSPVLTEYGDGFADFIAEFPPAASVPYLADMARLEHARVRAYHAHDAVPVAIDEYQALLAVPDRLAVTCLTLHPSCQWLHSEYAVQSIWAAHQDIGDLRDVDFSAIDIHASEDVLITRPLWDVQVATLPCGAIAFFDALQDGLTLGGALARAGDVSGSQLESLLALVVQSGLAIELTCLSEY